MLGYKSKCSFSKRKDKKHYIFRNNNFDVFQSIYVYISLRMNSSTVWVQYVFGLTIAFLAC